ncbi:MAG: hypothetical protein R3C28_02485 [Pirellulaceae bacterium]
MLTQFQRMTWGFFLVSVSTGAVQAQQVGQGIPATAGSRDTSVTAAGLDTADSGVNNTGSAAATGGDPSATTTDITDTVTNGADSTSNPSASDDSIGTNSTDASSSSDSASDSGEVTDSAAEVYDVSLYSSAGHCWFLPLTGATGELDFSSAMEEDGMLASGEVTALLVSESDDATLDTAGTWYRLDLDFVSVWLVVTDSPTDSLVGFGCFWGDSIMGRAWVMGEMEGRYYLFGSLPGSNDSSNSDSSNADSNSSNSDSGTADSILTSDTTVN